MIRSVAAALGIVLSAAAFKRFTTDALSTAGALQRVASTAGVAVSTLQELRFAGEQMGVTSAQIDSALERLSRRLGQASRGSGQLYETLKRNNIAIRDADKVFMDLADAVQNAGSHAERAQIVFSAFGREGSALINLLSGGSDAVRRFTKEAHQMGRVMRDEAAEAGAKLNTSLSNLFATCSPHARG